MTIALLLALGLLLLVGGALPQKGEGESCQTPDRRPGVCRLIRDCPHLYTLLQGRPTQDNIVYLNRAHCGFKGSVPVLCCPAGGSAGGGGGGNGAGGGGDPDPNPNPGPGPGPGPTNGDVSADVSRHPNLRLLPLDTCSPEGSDRIVGGEVADILSYPWIARLGYRSRSRPSSPLSYRCGGSLVSERYVLTAAHCVTALPGDLRLEGVRLGEHTVGRDIDCRNNTNVCNPAPLDYEVEEVRPHPQYSRQQMINDIALVRLRGRVDFRRAEFVRPVCLPVGEEARRVELRPGTKMIVAGWGTTEKGEVSRELLEVAVPLVPFERCRSAYTQARITELQLCAGGEKGRDSCSGDSGGPLMRVALVQGESKFVQFGVVSFGPKNCGTVGLPGIYTRISSYLNWLLDTMRP